MSSKRSREEDLSSDESTDDEQGDVDAGGAGAGRGDGDRLEQLKREKRLAMNRESARARRRRKKIRLETLEKQAEEMSKRHHDLLLANQQLKTRVAQLEAELAKVGANRPASSVVGSMDPTVMLGAVGAVGAIGGGGGVGQEIASLAGLGMSVEQRAALQQQAAIARMGGPGALAALGVGGMDADMQYLQLQQQLLSSSRGAAGTSTDAATRLMALEEMHRRQQMAALNQPQQGLTRPEELSRIGGADGLRGVSSMFGRSPADAHLASLLREQQHQQQLQLQQANIQQGGGGAASRDLKAELYERLANTNKKP